MHARLACWAWWLGRQGGQGYLRGPAERDVEGEVAGGIDTVRIGENARAVISLVKQRLAGSGTLRAKYLAAVSRLAAGERWTFAEAAAHATGQQGAACDQACNTRSCCSWQGVG